MNSWTIAAIASLPAMLAVSLSAVSLSAPPARAVSLVDSPFSAAGSSVASEVGDGAVTWAGGRVAEVKSELEKGAPIAQDPRYVERGGVLSSDDGTIYAVENGKATERMMARDEAGWDYTDWAFVERMKTHAVDTDSATDWFISVDVEAPVRLVLFHRENGEWTPVGGWYCTTGRKYKSSGLPREAGGA